ncbi:cation:proton antiporter [Entomomonas asaccharolytica]|uniref:Cation:proton antiporter n=1 Tax=Entomomonas asaccharolytica TaxID=2785331 RepID=A0A974NI44_9GAMM|nr:cation:proton antiporter [Entomomonas asaccharolytica]QQP87176.1 cation:proton antiporter [Entomomonas asaccharolytica]
MLFAGVTIVIFTRLKQPIVLGYMVAGFLIGPYFMKPGLIHDQDSIETLSQLGVIFLMFCLGLEFSIRRLFSVGATAFTVALLEIVVMVWLGHEIGRFFGWGKMDTLFLGALLAMSSTTIIVKALNDLKMKHERFAQLVFGALIVEDILGIGIIALLSGIATSGGEIDTANVMTTISKLVLFMVVSLVIGIIMVPRILSYIARFQSDEVMLVTVLGICFGFCLVVISLDYSVVLGAFLVGAIMAESRQLAQIERIIEPIRDLFSAIFFVTIGMLMDPSILKTYSLEIFVIAAAVIVGKFVSCGLGAFITGNDGRTSLRAGMGLSQIGEFSFIIAALGMSLGVTSDFLYSIVVAVSVITTLTTPYSIKLADPLSRGLAKVIPAPISKVFTAYTEWVDHIRLHGDKAVLAGMIRKIIMQVGINLSLVIAIFLAVAYFVGPISEWLGHWVSKVDYRKAIICGVAMILSLPFLIAAYRKLKALSMLLAEMSLKGSNVKLQRVIAEVIPALSMIAILVLLSALSSTILPSRETLIIVVAVTAVLTLVLWRWFVKIHSRLQIALFETLENNQENHHK